jgi:hypothetical protein
MENIDFIKTTNKFLEYNDYLKIYVTLNDDEKKKIINSYKDLINESIYKMINIFDLKLYTFRFWKDFFFLFYLALNIIKDYKSNSIIVSLGESPSKLIFTQSLFYNDDIYNKLKCKNYPINLNFKYLPLSKLSTELFIEENDILIKPFTEEKLYKNPPRIEFFKYNYNKTIRLMSRNYNKTIECNFKNYILNANLDIRNIIDSDKNIIIVDRAEGLSTLAALFFLYSKLNTWTTLSLEEKNIFFCKFSFYGFDIISNDVSKINKRNKIIINVKSFIKNLLNINDSVLEKIIKIKLIYNNYCKKYEVTNYIKNKNPKTIFVFSKLNYENPYNTITNVIVFLSLPEFLHLSSRCIKSYNLNEVLPEDLLTNFKQTDIKSINCNFFNFIIFLIFMKLKIETNEFDKLINNINNINIDFFYKDTKTDIPIDVYLKNLDNIKNFMNFFIDNPQIISKTIFNNEITFSYEETFNKDAASFKNKYLKYKNKYIEYKKEFDLEN